MNPFQRLVDVALGRAPADLVIQGGTLINTATAELLPGWGVAVAGERIAAIGDVSRCIGETTTVVDATGRYLAPGFVDPHYHIESSRLTPDRHAEVTLPRGLTTLVEDPHEACAVLGVGGIKFFLNAGKPLPQRIFCTVSSATPPSTFETAGGYIGAAEMAWALTQPGVLGLGELMDPPRLFDREERVWGMIETTRAAGRRLEGHGGFLPPEVDGFAAVGIGSSHSPRAAAEALAMLRRGLYLQLQVDRAAEIFPAVMASGADLSNVGLAVDDRAADRLLAVGALDYEVRRSIELGVPPARAYQMASFNNARYWRLEQDLGVLAPGRLADILLISSLEAVAVSRVYVGGRLVAEEGRMTGRAAEGLAASAAAALTPEVFGTVHLPNALTATDFRIPAGGLGAGAGTEAGPGAGDGAARVVVLKPGYYGKDFRIISDEVPVVDGWLMSAPGRGVTKVVVIDRHSGQGRMGRGFWRLGLQRGAVAFTIMHDSHNLCVAGVNDADMALAANRAAELGGGIVIAAGGKVLDELPLPVLGLMSNASLAEVAARQTRLDEIGRELGLDTALLGPRPVDRLTFLFLTCHPRKVQLTDQGIFDVESGRPVPLVLDELG